MSARGNVTGIALAAVTDFAALGERWRALEAQADCSFFQSWTWTGCLAEERFPDPVLLEARRDGETVALALFNRRRFLRETLLLGETGDAVRDTPFIEYNGVLVARRALPILRDCLRAARRQPIATRRPWLPRRLVLSGVDIETTDAARAAGPVTIRRSDPAPWIDLAPLRRGGDFLVGLSANTRYQLRRSDRAYAALGTLQAHRAATADEAHGWLDEAATLHQAIWTARGHPGAFAHPFFYRFHHALIDRGMPRGEIDLLRITAGAQLVGLLYNFRYRGHALAYQGGFDYAGAGRHQKPGLTCHHQAIRLAAAAGLDRYDLLAGEGRYKRSLAGDATRLHWLEIGWGGRVGGLARRAARSFRARWTRAVARRPS
ncbi:MAG TPA: GNAT family N-acetyltransferase [Acetobacteraceae bacterium]|jgi:CelD/BcsL family acetyltransferase involved in cellulose biosynthesis